jgi:A/G-specific adenine glycosylase
MEFPKALKTHFTTRMMAWHAAENQRSLPWKSEKDPYKIWLSEIILQQTRAQQGLPYYLRFTEAYPTAAALAAANDEEAFRLWQGLGYYNRCKNMLATARYITNELNGEFPSTHDELLKLKGIGPYTAAAIASFAYGLPQAVVDGNVYRVLSRYFAIHTPFDSGEGKKEFAALAQELLDKTDSAGYNQAIMDLGATVCKPRNPLCEECPLLDKCIARNGDLIAFLPVRSKTTKVRNRYFYYLILKWKDTIWITKRIENDIWQNLHEPYLIESNYPMTTKDLIRSWVFPKDFKYSEIKYLDSVTQRLTHQLIESHFYSVLLTEKPDIDDANSSWLTNNDLKKTAFPKTLVSFLEKNLYF